jgi:hypothetical protein
MGPPYLISSQAPKKSGNVRVARVGAVHEHVDVELREELPEHVGLGGEAIAGEVEHEGADLDAWPWPTRWLLVGATPPQDEPEARCGQAERERATVSGGILVNRRAAGRRTGQQTNRQSRLQVDLTICGIFFMG